MCQWTTFSYAENPTQCAADHECVDLAVEGRVAEHVTDLEHAASTLGRLHHPEALPHLRRDGLFQEYVVATLDRGQDRIHVQGVAGCDDGHAGPSG
jgi:hypothetical protein